MEKYEEFSKRGVGVEKEGTDQYSEIDEVIAYIHKHIDEPLQLSHLADIASYSPYHFTRIFKEKIGLPPLYYVSALRLQKAKDLLLQTNLTIRDIGLEIGQQSLGTFTTRFTERVGVTPSEFRRSAQEADAHFKSLRNLSDWETMSSVLLPGNSTIEGRIYSAVPFDGFILIGLFAKPIPEGLPLYGTLLPSLGRFRFADVRPGTYYLMATSVSSLGRCGRRIFYCRILPCEPDRTRRLSLGLIRLSVTRKLCFILPSKMIPQFWYLCLC